MTGTVKLISAGGGSVSLATPSTGSNRTVTFPDSDVNQLSDATLTTQGDTLYRDGSGLQRLAKGTAGQVLKMNSGATAPEWAAAGGANVLQVKMASQGNSEIEASYSSGTLTDMLSVTITPAATSSKFLVFANYRSYKNGAAIQALNTGLVRNVAGGGFSVLYSNNWDGVLQYSDANAKSVHANHWYLDAPSYSAGNALIYKSQAASGNGDTVALGRFTDLLVIELASGTAP
mgnify:CR=1 FL=1|tara:strand:- start:374 stop:1069 length:696 start_codon:yes stop_codon:yes gene_type:complete